MVGEKRWKNISKISPPCFFFLCKNSVFEILKPNIWHINSELTHSEINTLPQIFETSLDIELITRVFTELLSQKWGLSEVIKNKKKGYILLPNQSSLCLKVVWILVIFNF